RGGRLLPTGPSCWARMLVSAAQQNHAHRRSKHRRDIEVRHTKTLARLLVRVATALLREELRPSLCCLLRHGVDAKLLLGKSAALAATKAQQLTSSAVC